MLVTLHYSMVCASDETATGLLITQRSQVQITLGCVLINLCRLVQKES